MIQSVEIKTQFTLRLQVNECGCYLRTEQQHVNICEIRGNRLSFFLLLLTFFLLNPKQLFVKYLWKLKSTYC